MQQPNNEDIQKKPNPNIQEINTTTSDTTLEKTEHNKTEKIVYVLNGETTIQTKTKSGTVTQVLDETNEDIEKSIKIAEISFTSGGPSESNGNITIKRVPSKISLAELIQLIDIKENIEVYEDCKKYEQQDDGLFQCTNTYKLIDLKTPKPDISSGKPGFFPGHGEREKQRGMFFEIDYRAPEPCATKLKQEYDEQLKQLKNQNPSTQTVKKALDELLDAIKFIAEIKNDKAINTLEEFFKSIEAPEVEMSQGEHNEALKKECDEILKKKYNKTLKKLAEQNQNTQTTEETLGAKLQKIGLLASNTSNEALSIIETDIAEKQDQDAQTTQIQISGSSQQKENITRIRTTDEFEIAERAEEEEEVAKQNLTTQEAQAMADEALKKKFADKKTKLTLDFPDIYKPIKQNLNDQTTSSPSSINIEHTEDANQTTIEDQEVYEAIGKASDGTSQMTAYIEDIINDIEPEGYMVPQSPEPRPDTPMPEATKMSSNWSPEKRIHDTQPTQHIKTPIIGITEAATNITSEETKDDKSKKIKLVFERPEIIRKKIKPKPDTPAPEIMADSSSEKKHESCEACAKKPQHKEGKLSPDVEYTTYEHTLSKVFDNKEKAELLAQNLSAKAPEEVINASSEKDALTLDPQEYMDQLSAEIELTTSKPEELKPNTQITEATSSTASEKTIDSTQNISI